MSHYPAIKIDCLSYAYPDGTQALNGLTLEIHDGEKLGILGPNGAGKSTLLLHLNGIIQSGGEVRIFGLPVQKKTLRQIRQRVGLIFQNPDDQLFCPTVFDDVAFGARQLGLLESEVAERVAHSLLEVGLSGVEKKNSYHLSFGQKKLAAIATVLSMDVRILVFDEPTAGLDPRARRQVIHLLDHIGRTQIIASHDIDMLRQSCDRIAILHNGAIAATGAPDEIIGNTALLEKYDLV